MAVMAVDSKKLEIAEEACAAIARYDKVDYIRFIKVIADFISDFFNCTPLPLIL